ncbi:MAG: amidohydrolase/deacetylase family metallohydrolase [Acidobacteria bacterium]|nr:amidohydrolase/deacetylase family metallohydrolase [Acidobacteriota bacterium]
MVYKYAPAVLLLSLWLGSKGYGQARYDLLLQGGHVIDPKNGISAVRDVAVKDGRIAAVAPHLDRKDALKTVSAAGLYVTPGLVDIHAHVYTGTGERASYAGDNSVYPDGFTFRVGVTTVADAGGSGWRNFEDFKQRVIDRSKTRVLAFLNIVGHGMRGAKFENDLADMEAAAAAEMAKRYPGLIVGFKTAHYAGPEWTPVEHAVEAGTMAGIPVMVDFGTDHPERPLADLVTKKLRPGDIYTHCYSGLRHELDDSGHVNPGMIEGRKRGVIFDVGHGGGSFAWRIAVPAIRQGFLPDSISTDLHIGSMNTGMKDMLNVMDKFLAMGLSLDDVIVRSTWNPAREIHHEELGNLSVGSPADIAVLRLETGRFGFTDMYGARMDGRRKLTCELTVHNGRVVYDLNGMSRPVWTTLPPGYTQVGDAAWDALNPKPVRRAPAKKQ